MGYLIHGTHEYQFEDRLLGHLKFVIGQKLLKQESFFLSWTKSADEGSGRVSLWMSSYVTLAFRFHGNANTELNATWIKVLSALSHSSRGLVVLTEEEAEKYAKTNPAML